MAVNDRLDSLVTKNTFTVKISKYQTTFFIQSVKGAPRFWSDSQNHSGTDPVSGALKSVKITQKEKKVTVKSSIHTNRTEQKPPAPAEPEHTTSADPVTPERFYHYLLSGLPGFCWDPLTSRLRAGAVPVRSGSHPGEEVQAERGRDVQRLQAQGGRREGEEDGEGVFGVQQQRGRVVPLLEAVLDRNRNSESDGDQNTKPQSSSGSKHPVWWKNHRRREVTSRLFWGVK